MDFRTAAPMQLNLAPEKSPFSANTTKLKFIVAVFYRYSQLLRAEIWMRL